MAFGADLINLKCRKCSQQTKPHRTFQIITLSINMEFCREEEADGQVAVGSQS